MALFIHPRQFFDTVSLVSEVRAELTIQVFLRHCSDSYGFVDGMAKLIEQSVTAAIDTPQAIGTAVRFHFGQPNVARVQVVENILAAKLVVDFTASDSGFCVEFGGW